MRDQAVARRRTARARPTIVVVGAPARRRAAAAPSVVEDGEPGGLLLTPGEVDADEVHERKGAASRGGRLTAMARVLGIGGYIVRRSDPHGRARRPVRLGSPTPRGVGSSCGSRPDRAVRSPALQPQPLTDDAARQGHHCRVVVEDELGVGAQQDRVQLEREPVGVLVGGELVLVDGGDREGGAAGP